MATLESDKVHKALTGKMQVKADYSPPDVYYVIYNDSGVAISSTSISKGAKHTLGHKRVRDMAHQLCLDSSQQLVEVTSCRLTREQALAIMERNCPPGGKRQRSAG